MIRNFLFIILILLIISFILIIVLKRRNKAIKIYSIQTFLSSSSYNELQEEPHELKASIIQTINNFFTEKTDEIADVGDIDGDDAGE